MLPRLCGRRGLLVPVGLRNGRYESHPAPGRTGAGPNTEVTMMSKSWWRAAALASLLTVSAVGITACEDREGPAERAGEEIDEAVDEAKDALD